MILLETTSGIDGPVMDHDHAMVSSTESTKQLVSCQICFDDFNAVETYSKLCNKSCPASICRSCLSAYILNIIESTPAGVLSTLKCPICVCPINLMRWKARCSDQLTLIDAFEEKIQASCDVLCPDCHNTTNVLPEVANSTFSIKLFPNLASKISRLRQLGELYCRHKVSLQDLWTYLITEFPGHYLALLEGMLPLIHDTERRAGLCLRMLHDNPFIYSNCCNVAVCFKCKVEGHHDDVSCSAMFGEVEEVASCPSCNLMLVKGDGCEWITCFCGEGFDWTVALRAFIFSKVSTKQLGPLKILLKTYMHRRRFRKLVLLDLVRQVNIRLHKQSFQIVFNYLRFLSRRRYFYKKVVCTDEFCAAILTIQTRHCAKILSTRPDIYVLMTNFVKTIRVFLNRRKMEKSSEAKSTD